MIIGNFFQRPASVLDYRIDWTDWLAGDTISSGEFSVSPSSPSVIASQSTSSTVGTVWVSNGTSGTAYTLTHRVSTTGGRTDERSFTVSIVP